MKKQYITTSEKETFELGEKLAKKLKGGEIIGLEGELGAGKTILAKGIAMGLGIKKNITSPTFVVMKIYKIKNPKLKIQNLVHVDAYRIEGEQELVDIGLGEYLGSKNLVVIIEWADKVKKMLKGKTLLQIKLKLGKNNIRTITINK